ncbi:hypothetical protein AMK09_21500 [Streptomyces sp. CB02488]|uniref:hypothetical protein n=1 Tax=Streptomyces sp. CB02488 TaxID=1703920 RepID=UPI00093E0FC5|nr:hypothetical protein [Streptomyces sp. CB02488]OKK17125.1 hypothetical protein AMK09_21500 [Streptomyces sp. CB02488]
MSIWYRPAGLVRAHWKLAFLPIGFVLNLWSNQLYDTRHQAVGGVLFVLSIALIVVAGRHWRKTSSGFQAPKSVRLIRRRLNNWLTTTFYTPEWLGRREKAKVAIWGIIAFKVSFYPLNVADRIIAAPDQFIARYGDAQKMLALCLLFPYFAHWLEPKDRLLERLEGRVLRAMVSRTIGNFNGACGVAVLLYAVLSTISRDYTKVLPALAVSIAIATLVATHKMWTRYRKLCTQAHKNIQALIRALEQSSEAGTHLEVLDAWEVAERDLRTRVDTGYVFGMRFAPKVVIAAIGEAVDKVNKGLPGQEEARAQAVTDLEIIRGVCVERIDAVA